MRSKTVTPSGCSKALKRDCRYFQTESRRGINDAASVARISDRAPWLYEAGVMTTEMASSKGRICPQKSRKVKGKIRAGVAIPSVAFFARPRQTSDAL